MAAVCNAGCVCLDNSTRKLQLTHFGASGAGGRDTTSDPAGCAQCRGVRAVHWPTPPERPPRAVHQAPRLLHQNACMSLIPLFRLHPKTAALLFVAHDKQLVKGVFLHVCNACLDPRHCTVMEDALAEHRINMTGIASNTRGLIGCAQTHLKMLRWVRHAGSAHCVHAVPSG